MKIIKRLLDEVLVLESPCYSDQRGCFIEQFNQQKFTELIGESVNFVQENLSVSQANVLRGLHYQTHPHQQDKLIRVLAGEILDVFVDVRPNSANFAKYASIRLNANLQQSIWLPAGFAHGFLSLQDNTQLQYKTTKTYQPTAELSISWDDPDLAINWQLEQLTKNLALNISDKDAKANSWQQFCNSIKHASNLTII